MTETDPKSNAPTDAAAALTTPIAALLPNLFYPSESDEAVEWVTCPLKTEQPLTVSHIKDWLMLPPSVYVEEGKEADFWQPVTTEEDWYGDEEKARTATFKQLQAAMQTLTDRQLFRVGQTEVDVYLLGRVPDKTWAGLKTKVVET